MNSYTDGPDLKAMGLRDTFKSMLPDEMTNREAMRRAGQLFGLEFRKRLANLYAYSSHKAGRRGDGGNLQELAKDTGIHYTSLHRIKSGLRLPGEEHLKLICDKLRWNVDEALKLYPSEKLPKRGRPRRIIPLDKWKAGKKRFSAIISEWSQSRFGEKKGRQIIDEGLEFCNAVKIKFGYFETLMRKRALLPSMETIERISKFFGKNPYRLLAIKALSMMSARRRAEILPRWLPDEQELIADAAIDKRRS